MPRFRQYPYDSGRARFGLASGQLRARSDRLMKNAGWYDASGRKLGWGDLSASDIRRIAASLRRGELFIILGERDSFWTFVTRHGLAGPFCRTSRREKNPGKRYLAEHAQYVVAPRRRWVVDRYGSLKQRRIRIAGLDFERARADDVRSLILGP